MTHDVAGPAEGATRKVYRGILRGLAQGDLVPGQRLVETELATTFGVGRNAVREAMQRLGARGVVDLSRHRSAAIRQLDLPEALEILDVADAMIALACRIAAERFEEGRHRAQLDAALAGIDAADEEGEPWAFATARRGFYRALLAIGGNRELTRLFPAIGIHIIHAKYQSLRLQRIRLADYHLIAEAIASGDATRAEEAARVHSANVRAAIIDQARRTP